MNRILLFVIGALSLSINAQEPFVTTWKTDNPGYSDSTSILISINPDYNYNYDVDWNNDGVYDDLGVTTAIVHDYGVAGTYTIAIRGHFLRLIFIGTK